MRFAAFGLVFMAALSAWGQDQEAMAEQMLRKIDAVVNPQADLKRLNDASYYKDYQGALRRTVKQRADLIATFYKSFPEHPRIGELLEKRWAEAESLAEKPGDLNAIFQGALQEIDLVLSRPPEGLFIPLNSEVWPPASVKIPALYWRSLFKIRMAGGNFEAVFAEATDFAEKVPEDSNRAMALVSQAAFSAKNPGDAAKAYQYLITKWPYSPQTPLYKGLLRQTESRGKSVTFDLDGLVNSAPQKTASMAGNVIILDFFSSTLQGTSGRLAALKMLKNELGAQGLIILSICMDEDKTSAQIKEWAAANKVEWPVQALGPKIRKEWLEGWGILSVPNTFVVDRKGILRFVNTPGNLKGEVEKLLKEKA